MLCTNVLFHGTSFDFNSSPTRKMALTNGIPLGIKIQNLYFAFIAYTKSKREFKKKSYNIT